MSDDEDLDDDGYPTDAALKRIEQWPVKSRGDCEALMTFVHSLWNYPEDFYQSADGTWHVSTVGWSGNESLIDAMGRNFVFWSLCWKQARRGGHYEFDLERFPGGKKSRVDLRSE